MQQKRVPMRMCLGCSEMKPKKELVRIVRSPEGNVSIDFVGKASGRGAYICKDAECLTKAVKSKRLEKNFGHAVAEEIIASLKEALTSENG